MPEVSVIRGDRISFPSASFAVTDEVAPTVTIVSPRDGVKTGATVTVRIDATDNVAVTEVILRADGATIYRNVEAELVGAEIDAWWRLSEHLSLTGNAGWVRAENTDDNRPLPQIPALNGVVELTLPKAKKAKRHTIKVD